MNTFTTTHLPAKHHRTDGEAWYRQLWPWLLIAGPAIVVVAALATAWIAAATDDGVIADDYYKRGLMINKELDRTARADAMALGAVLHVAPDGAVRLEMSGFAKGAAPDAVTLTLVHPTRAGQDRGLTLKRDAEGAYIGTLVAPVQGRWHVAIDADAWRLVGAVTQGDLTEVRIGMARAVD
ncbi:MAG TPA: FixH family protein [Casimicrobiaceae bacterium]